VNRSCAPFDRVTVPVYVWPDTALGVISVVAGNMTTVVEADCPGTPMMQEPAGVYLELRPAQMIEMDATDAVPVPVSVSAKKAVDEDVRDEAHVNVLVVPPARKSAAGSPISVTAIFDSVEVVLP
jgi:hypothetical protein